MTDASMYTGAHKSRFDEDGKGKVNFWFREHQTEPNKKGLDGRTDKVDNSGYVGAYKGAGTYGSK